MLPCCACGECAAALAAGVRTYAVTPVGPTAGLIQWLDHAVPLFTLYKRWQLQEAAASAKAAAGAPRKPGKKKGQRARGGRTFNIHARIRAFAPRPFTAPRPAELFHEAIKSALAHAGMTLQTPRSKWPLAALRDTLQQLEHATPPHLLENELWTASVDAPQWWRRQRR